MTSRTISGASAIILCVGGTLLLFAPDVLLRRIVPGFPDAALWVGQLVGAGWLAVAALDWLSRSAVLGGIYGRPVVLANIALHFISSLTLVEAATHEGASSGLWLLATPFAILASVYGWLLLHGPTEREMQRTTSA